MKQTLYALSLLLAATVTLSSCLGSDETNTVTLRNDAALYSFALGTLHRYYQPANNPDSTISTSVVGSYYPMTIDHLKGVVFNHDSLPAGTVPKALCTVSALNSGVIGLKPLNDSLFVYFNSSDSVDFSEPRIFRVLSSDGTFYRDYTVTVNVAKDANEFFTWVKTDSIILPGELSDCQPVFLNGKLEVVSGNAVVKDSFVYRLIGEDISRSEDAQTWETVATATGLKQLLGAASNELFGMGTDGLLKASRDNGITWTDEKLDDRKELLPVSDMACVSLPYAPRKNTDYVLLVGNSANAADTACTVWRKISYYTEAPEKSQWVYMPNDPENKYTLPRQNGLSMAAFEGNVLAIGSDLTTYLSTDQGITWQKNTDYSVPAGMTGTKVKIVEGDDCVWMVTDKGEVWNGRRR